MNILKGTYKKGPFSEEERDLLRELIQKHGGECCDRPVPRAVRPGCILTTCIRAAKWSKVAGEMDHRSPSQVRHTWQHMLAAEARLQLRVSRVGRRKSVTGKRKSGRSIETRCAR